MEPNLLVLLILTGVAIAAALIVAVAQSRSVKEFGLLGALRRKFSGGSHRSPYGF